MPADTAVKGPGGIPAGCHGPRLAPAGWPREPHDQTVPSERSATLLTEPAAMAVKVPDSDVTGAAVERDCPPPSPSWFQGSSPQAHTLPSDRSARLWAPPLATAVTEFSPPTFTGKGWPVVVPSPSWP